MSRTQTSHTSTSRRASVHADIGRRLPSQQHLGRRPIFVTLPFWELFQPPANVYPWEFEASFVAGYPSSQMPTRYRLGKICWKLYHRFSMLVSLQLQHNPYGLLCRNVPKKGWKSRKTFGIWWCHFKNMPVPVKPPTCHKLITIPFISQHYFLSFKFFSRIYSSAFQWSSWNCIFQSIDLDLYSKAEELESLGLDELKMTLTSLGMKCGGTLQERAKRLFSVKGLKPEEIPTALLAKPAGKKKWKQRQQNIFRFLA